ncbi:uncharacterized protein [Nothobranchius furzeri]
MSSVAASKQSGVSFRGLPMESWMSHLPCALWDTPLFHLAIPGSHNAITYCLDTNNRSPVDPMQPDMLQQLDKFMKPFIRPFVYKWAITQEFSVKQQLDCGVRYYDLRIAHRPNDSSTDLYFYHGVYTTLTVETVLKEINDWLDAHPKEVVILSFSHFLGLNQDLHVLLLMTIRTIFTSKLCPKTGIQSPKCNMSSVAASKQSGVSFRGLPMESWMSHLPCALWDTPLFHLAIPGSHNAITYCLDTNNRSPVDPMQPDMLQQLDKFMKPFIRPFVYKWAITQEFSVKQQLDCGVRYYDLRIAHRPNDSSTDLYFYHGVYTTLTVETVLKEINDWLDAHPKEVVILSFSHFLGLNQDLHVLLLMTIRTIFTSKLCPKTGIQSPKCNMSSVAASKQSGVSFRGLPMESWMSHLPCALWDTPLFHLAIPGSHNAITYCLDTNNRSPVDPMQPDMLQQLDKFMKPFIRPFVYKWAITQEFSVKQQLDCGVRYYDLRIAHRPNDSSTDLYFYHGVYTTLTVETVLKEINDWLDAHPKEVVILSFSHFLGLNQDLHVLLLMTIRTIFTSKLCPKTEVLTLQNLWALGYQVIVSYEHNIVSSHSDLWPHIPYWWANKCKAEALIEEFERRKQHDRPGGFFVTGINLTEDLKYICTHPTESLKDLVMSTYPTLLGWVKEQTPGSRVGSLNIIAGDFITESHFAATVVSLNEKLLEGPS